MPQGKKGKNVPVASGRDGIDALPDGVLEQILGFLPAEETGRTSMLVQRWCHLWKSATPLRTTCIREYWMNPAYVMERPKIVDDMLCLRGHAPLEACEITFGDIDGDDCVLCLNRWLRHVVMCRVQRLRFENIYYGQPFELDDLPLVSRRLTKLELVGIVLKNDFCDFSSCPSLEHLEITNCYLWNAKKLSSESLKHLSLTICDFNSEFHTFIFVPCLVYLNLDSHLWRTPLLGRMPSLKRAFVRFPIETNYSSDCEDDDCYSCHNMVDDNKCFLLDGLSNAENLALLSESVMVCYTFVYSPFRDILFLMYYLYPLMDNHKVAQKLTSSYSH
jgi:hypothetical protein